MRQEDCHWDNVYSTAFSDGLSHILILKICHALFYTIHLPNAVSYVCVWSPVKTWIAHGFYVSLVSACPMSSFRHGFRDTIFLLWHYYGIGFYKEPFCIDELIV